MIKTTNIYNCSSFLQALYDRRQILDRKMELIELSTRAVFDYVARQKSDQLLVCPEFLKGRFLRDPLLSRVHVAVI